MNKDVSNKIVTRDAVVRDTTAEMLENRQVEFVISSEAVDTYGTVFKLSGGDFSRFDRGGVVFYMHNSHSDDEDNVLGPGEVFIEEDKLIGRVTFEGPEVNEKADKIFRKIASGTPFMASIAARVLEAEMGREDLSEDKNIVYFRKWELMEFSVVPIGSNPDAHKRNAQTLTEIRTGLAIDVDVVDPVEIESRSVQEAQIIINKNRI